MLSILINLLTSLLGKYSRLLHLFIHSFSHSFVRVMRQVRATHWGHKSMVSFLKKLFTDM